MSNKREIRSATVPIEARDEDNRTIGGYAIVYNTETTIGGFFREIIEPGAARSATLPEADVRAFWQHQSENIIGRTKSKTLRLSEDEQGLAVEIDLPDSPLGHTVFQAVKRGDVDGMSFGFIIPDLDKDQEWQDEDKAVPLRRVKRLEVIEVSPVTFPAYEATTLAARSAEDVLEDFRSLQAAESDSETSADTIIEPLEAKDDLEVVEAEPEVNPEPEAEEVVPDDDSGVSPQKAWLELHS